MATPYDHLDIDSKKAVFDNAIGVIRDVDRGSTDYTPDQYAHAQETAHELKTDLGLPASLHLIEQRIKTQEDGCDGMRVWSLDGMP
jgi:hypothetical protein